MRRSAVSIAIALALFATGALAQTSSQPAPFKPGDAKAGKALVDKDCVGCHAAQFGGDADRMYTRAEHRVRTPGQLLAQVQACNLNLNKGYFPDEEEHIAAYLNLEFYKFKP
jgi:mono/diheme cytochrome c family protein